MCAGDSNLRYIYCCFQKERKNNKRERPKIKSVAIVPSDDSDSDAHAAGTSATSDSARKADVAKIKEKEKGKEVTKEKGNRGGRENVKQNSSKQVERAAAKTQEGDWASGKQAELRGGSGHEPNKLADADRQLEFRFEHEEVGLLKLKWDSIDEVHGTTKRPLSVIAAPPEETPKITVILSRPDVQKDSTFSSNAVLSPQEASYAPGQDVVNQIQLNSVEESLMEGMAAKTAPELPQEGSTTGDSFTVVDGKDKKKKHKKDKDRAKSHEHMHRHKDKKKDKEHRKDKKREKSTREGHGCDGKHEMKRHADETEAIDGQPLPKVPKLKIIIGGGASSVQASPSSTGSPLASPVTSEQLILKVKPLTSQESVETLVHAAEREPAGAPQSDNKKVDEKEPKRPPCVTKAELKAITKSPKKKRLPPIMAKSRKE
ncbi:unnamed protein product [Toxocara canis]|uniref:Uncharacterized protein n=1 Tax=Toxocara canis TaxID=6265 RepID=A0A3P7GVG9_TOXCA|nr:unnamed protein product [Toxocara canis]